MPSPGSSGPDNERASSVSCLSLAAGSSCRCRCRPRSARAAAPVTLLTLREGHLCWGVRQEHAAGEYPPVDAWLMGAGSRVSGV